MTENEAIKILGDTTLLSPLGQAAFKAIECIKEVQQYRKIGTVEQVRKQKHNLEVAYKIIDNYESVGTVKEFLEAVEKQKPMKVNEVHVDEYYCPACGSENCCDQGKVCDKYCPVCGHAIYQEESEEE